MKAGKNEKRGRGGQMNRWNAVQNRWKFGKQVQQHSQRWSVPKGMDLG